MGKTPHQYGTTKTVDVEYIGKPKVYPNLPVQEKTAEPTVLEYLEKNPGPFTCADIQKATGLHIQTVQFVVRGLVKEKKVHAWYIKRVESAKMKVFRVGKSIDYPLDLPKPGEVKSPKTKVLEITRKHGKVTNQLIAQEAKFGTSAASKAIKALVIDGVLAVVGRQKSNSNKGGYIAVYGEVK